MALSRREQNRAFKKNIIYGNQILHEWEVKYNELAYIILKQNLSILDLPKRFNRYSNYDPNYYKIDSTKLIENILFKQLNLVDEAFWLPEIQKATDYVRSLLPQRTHKMPVRPRPQGYFKVRLFAKGPDGSLHLIEDKKENHFWQACCEPKSSLRVVIEEHENDIKNNPNVFSLIGKVWFVKYKNQEWGLFPDLEKYKYIACLLELTKSYSDNHEYSIFNSDLMAKIKNTGDSDEDDNEELKQDLNESDLGESLTYEDFKRFKDIGYELLDKINDAKQSGDPIKKEEAQKNFKDYQIHIANEYGIKSQISKDGSKIYFKTYHRISKESERLRQSVKNQINNAIKDFKKSMPMFGQHLQICLSTKLNKTLYIPQGIQWQV